MADVKPQVFNPDHVMKSDKEIEEREQASVS